MLYFDITLTEKDYNNMLELDHKARNRYLEKNVLSPSIIYGYGFYGHIDLREENGSFLVNICTGSTCD